MKAKLEEGFTKVWKSMEEKLESMKESKGNEGSTFFERVFDNLTVTIGDIELRLETFSSEPSASNGAVSNAKKSRSNKNEFAFGGRIKQLKVRTIDSEKNLVFVQRKSKFDKIRKMISVESIELYHDSQKIQNIDQYSQYLN